MGWGKGVLCIYVCKSENDSFVPVNHSLLFPFCSAPVTSHTPSKILLLRCTPVCSSLWLIKKFKFQKLRQGLTMLPRMAFSPFCSPGYPWWFYLNLPTTWYYWSVSQGLAIIIILFTMLFMIFTHAYNVKTYISYFTGFEPYKMILYVG